MACYTMTRVEIDDNAINKKARKKLNLPLTGSLSQRDARLVTIEAGVIKTQQTMRRLAPGAVIRRKGNILTINVTR